MRQSGFPRTNFSTSRVYVFFLFASARVPLFSMSFIHLFVLCAFFFCCPPQSIFLLHPCLYIGRLSSLDSLISQPCTSPIRAKHMNAEKITGMIGFGGVRIEDDVIITDDGMELMTNVPRTGEAE